MRLKGSDNTDCKGSRIYLFDNVKFLAIILVVIGHSIDFLTARDGNFAEKSLFFVIYSVHMPLFIFMSGLFLKPMDKSTPFPKQKFLAFLLIGIVLRAFMGLWRLFLGKSPNYAVFDMYDSFAWYMGAMAAFIAITWLFREYNTKIIILISAFIGCMAGYDKFLGDKLSLMRIFVFLPVFLAGYYFRPEQLIKLFSKKWLKLISAVAVAAIILTLFFNVDLLYSYLRPMFTGRNTFTCLGDYYNYGFLVRLACYLISGIFGFAIMCVMPNKNIKFFTGFGQKTLQIYFWHRFFLLAFERFEVYDKISALTGDTLATLIYIFAAVALTYFCSLNIFSFPTKQLLSFGKPKKQSAAG